MSTEEDKKKEAEKSNLSSPTSTESKDSTSKDSTKNDDLNKQIVAKNEADMQLFVTKQNQAAATASEGKKSDNDKEKPGPAPALPELKKKSPEDEKKDKHWEDHMLSLMDDLKGLTQQINDVVMQKIKGYQSGSGNKSPDSKAIVATGPINEDQENKGLTDAQRLDCCKKLGFDKEETSPTKIKAAYKAISLECHPDKIKEGDPDKEAKINKFTDAAAAYKTLSDQPEYRKAFEAEQKAKATKEESKDKAKGLSAPTDTENKSNENTTEKLSSLNNVNKGSDATKSPTPEVKENSEMKL